MISGAMTKRFPVGLTITAAVALAILIALGVWQLYRLQWKLGVLARRDALIAAEPRPLDQVLSAQASARSLDMVRVSVTCPGLAQAPAARLFSLVDGEVVNRLISVCRLNGTGGYNAILVDRGSVPADVTAPPNLDPAAQTPVALTGVLRDPAANGGNPLTRWIAPETSQEADGGTLWMRYDPPAMAAALGAENAAPVFLAAETSSNPDWPALKPGLPAVEIPNRHLEYALTWFALAAVMLTIYAAMLTKRLKGS